MEKRAMHDNTMIQSERTGTKSGVTSQPVEPGNKALPSLRLCFYPFISHINLPKLSHSFPRQFYAQISKRTFCVACHFRFQ